MVSTSRLLLAGCGTLLALLVASCGGGGGGTPTSTPTYNLERYAGVYAGVCEPVIGGTMADSGDPLYGKTTLIVGSTTGKSATLSIRIDFYDDAICVNDSVGSITNNNPLNSVALVNSTLEEDRRLDAVLISLGSAGLETPTANATIGSAFRLSLPGHFVDGGTIKDLWLLYNGTLFRGGTTFGPDGYPDELSSIPRGTKGSSVPAGAPSPCPATSLTWTISGQTCGVSARGDRNGTNLYLLNTKAGQSGHTYAVCNNGTWQTDSNQSCFALPTPVLFCPAQSITWTVGSDTCQGSVESTQNGALAVAQNLTGPNKGLGAFTCTPGGYTPLSTTCALYVPPAPLTDPVEINVKKNCSMCHTATGSGGFFPSYQTIADYYRNNVPASGYLENKVKFGGIGTFGQVPMSGNPQISDEELAIILPWILNR